MNNQNKDYLFPEKSKLVKININDITLAHPDLKNTNESKVSIISKWLVNWIESDLAAGKIQVYNIIPSKAEFAYIC